MSDDQRVGFDKSIDIHKGLVVPTRISGLSKKITISANITADQWELYDGIGRDEVASRLSTAFENAVNSGLNHRDVSHEVEKVMTAYRDHGAADSEPMRMLERILAEVFR